MKRDKFGAMWPDDCEVCAECGQPDNCGDCNHNPLSTEDVFELGGKRLCEFGCGKVATHYGGWQYASDWAGYCCSDHAGRLPWSEPLPAETTLPDNPPHNALKYHVTGAVGRGAEPITERPS